MTGPEEGYEEEHLNGLALFLDPPFRARFRTLLASPKGRVSLRRKLDHYAHLDPRFTEEVPGSSQNSGSLGDALKQRGAPGNCYVLSSDPDLDGSIAPLGQAFESLVDAGSEFGTFISCVPGKLAYFHGENRHHRYILERKIDEGRAT